MPRKRRNPWAEGGGGDGAGKGASGAGGEKQGMKWNGFLMGSWRHVTM